MTTALADALFVHLQKELDGARPGDRWVMDAAWRDEVRELEGHCGDALLIPSRDGREFLFGYPVEVRAGGGVPHLEPS